ncbi:MAG: DUF927 domain-containing protein [Oribacterium sp.]|nr:DUF927 domain-containing protein [Oribacterium sp.]
MDISQINGSNVLNLETIRDLFNIENNFEREQISQALREIAKANGKTKAFDNLTKAYAKVIKLPPEGLITQNTTNFSDLPDGLSNIPCGVWTADDQGVRIQSRDGTYTWACRHPIVPVARFKNIQTGKELIKIAYKRDTCWQDMIVAMDVLSHQNKIIDLSAYGILVNSNSARNLIKYFNDVLSKGIQYIPVSRSSSKFGWIDGEFIPYGQAITFDAESIFKQLSDSIKTHGDENLWMQCIADIRKNSSFVVRLMMAASFGSILIGKLDVLNYWVDLWGETEGGKTITLKVCTSIWADPCENKFLGDFKSTDVALEAKANALNNLPMIIDDTANTTAYTRDNFENMVYNIASGKGKSRSDINIGLRHENCWHLIALTSGESPLSSFVSQGGAINRILEVKADTKLYDDFTSVIECVSSNYGFAGKRFVDAVQSMSDEDLKQQFKEIKNKVQEAVPDAMQKQSLSLSAILLADKIATDYIFKDGIYLNIDDASEVLVDPEELSPNERAYEYICGKIAMNPSRFNPLYELTEQWGVSDGKSAYIYHPAFIKLCRDGKINKKTFCDWAIKEGVLIPDGRGCPASPKRILNYTGRVYHFILPDNYEK